MTGGPKGEALTDASRQAEIRPLRAPSNDAGIDLESQYRSIFENAVEGIYQTTIDGQYIRVNPALAQIYGFASPADLIVNLTDIAGQLYVDPTRRDDFKQAMAEAGTVRDFEAQVYRADRSVIWITENARCVRAPDGAILYYEGTVEDITRRKADEENIRLLATVFDSVGEGILIVDGDLVVKAVNPAYEAICGLDAAALVNRPLDLLAKGFHDNSFVPAILHDVETHGHWSGEATCQRRNGEFYLAALSVYVVRGREDDTSQMIVTCTDITFRKEQEHRIWHHANFDLLTELPNRWLMTERLQQHMLRAARKRTGLAVLFLDLNGFKQINDSLGHQAGDELLRLVARRLKACTRLSDAVGRLGGDEFLIVAPDATDAHGGAHLAEKILYTFADPFRLADREIFCVPAIGITYYPEHGSTADDLIRNADVAMYEAKRNRGRPFATFAPQMLEVSARRLEVEHDLHRAFENREFVLYYQPKVDAHTGRVVGAEALVRWYHPKRGIVPPSEFIPLAEECGLITALGEWTLREACEQLTKWQAEGIPIASVSVNLSPRQFVDASLISVVQRILQQTAIDPACLELELTEGAMSVDIEKAIFTLQSLKALGLRLSIDDFGTGYSSLTYLKRLPVDVVKIDQSFVRDLEDHTADSKIIAAIIGLADVLGFDVVAEGVETEKQVEILRLTRCDVFQGYLYSRPVTASQFAAFTQAPANR
ncbi:MAG: bifunctional diguanylate cyclase/phosphodiesterase [Rhodospirillaceae bacterium]|nr:MAG: bifunctional diguanylate cyclase/phosphodiesterase [Rhodospirillaceae bacterium]